MRTEARGSGAVSTAPQQEGRGGDVRFELTEDQRALRDAVREFCKEEILPVARQIDEAEKIPPDLREKIAGLGLWGMLIPQEHGGLGLDAVSYCAVIEELARASAALCIAVAVHNSVGCAAVTRFGTEEQKRCYLPRMLAKDLVAFALTEPGAGSDAAAIRTTARLDGDAYVLDGTKVFVTNGAASGLVIVFARTGGEGHHGISAFLVEKSTPGLKVGTKELKMGLRGSDTVELVFDGCRVPKEQLLGSEGGGFKIAMSLLDGGRVGVAAQAVGIARAAFEEARRYAMTRVQFGVPIAEFQAVQWMIADMAIAVESARLLTMRAAWMKDGGIPSTREASMAKLYASEKASYVCDRAVQIHGGYGYIRDYPVERYYRDARVTSLYEGTSEIQRIVIARSLLKD
jgi:alkylation response protein AidB-like acyl-CoA dehydrogenase